MMGEDRIGVLGSCLTQPDRQHEMTCRRDDCSLTPRPLFSCPHPGRRQRTPRPRPRSVSAVRQASSEAASSDNA